MNNKKKVEFEIKNLLKIAAALLFWLAAWTALYFAVGKDYIIPSPLQVAAAFWQLLISGEFWQALGITLLRVIAGLTLSFVLALISSFLAYHISFFRIILDGITNFFKAVPVMSIIMIVILWLTSGLVPVFVCFLMCFPVIYTNLMSGADSVPDKYIDEMRLYTGSNIQKYTRIILPMSRPHIKTALQLSGGLSWKTVIAAEVLSSPKVSMGVQLLLSKTYFEADKLFAWTIAIVIASVIFTRLLRFALRGISD